MPLVWEPYDNPMYRATNPDRRPTPHYPVTREVASILSRNGAVGAAFLTEWADGHWTLEAVSETTGLPWKATNEKFTTADDAKGAAEKLWRCLYVQDTGNQNPE